MFYLEILAAPKNHILQHDTSARSPGTGPQSREQATEEDCLQGRGADHSFGRLWQTKKKAKCPTPLVGSPFCISSTMTNLDVWVIIFPCKSWTLRFEDENIIIDMMLKIWETLWQQVQTSSSVIFDQTRQSFVNNLMPNRGTLSSLTFPTIIGGLLTWILLQVSKYFFFPQWNKLIVFILGWKFISLGWILKYNACTDSSGKACRKAVPSNCNPKSNGVGEEAAAAEWSSRNRQQRSPA